MERWKVYNRLGASGKELIRGWQRDQTVRSKEHGFMLEYE